MSKDDVRAELLQAAGAIFAAEGYRNATVRKICKRAGVNVAAVNYYFGDKERLYIEAVKHARSLIEQRWPLPDWSAELTPEARLKGFLQTFLRRLLSPQTSEWQMRLLLREIIEPTRAGEQMVRTGFQPLFERLLEIIRPLVPVGLAAPQLQQIGFSIIAQCVFYRAHQLPVALMVTGADREEYFAVEPLAEHIFQFSLAAMQGLNRTSDKSVAPTGVPRSDVASGTTGRRRAKARPGHE